MNLENTICSFLIADVKRRLIDESVPRITKCLEILSQDEIWYRSNNNTNSVGNLILHLCGNLRQYIISGIDGQIDRRERSKEFEARGKIDKEVLLRMLNDLMDEVFVALDRIEARHLVETRQVQCFNENITSILMHVVEHFSYHTGQIVYFTKYLKDVDTGFYSGLDLDANAN